MAPDLLNFPSELLITILAFLDPQDLLAARLTCSHLHKLISTTALLQYNSALRSLCLINNPSPNCKLSISERLKLLKDREKAWCNLESVFATDVPVNHNPSGIYDLTGGVYLLGEFGRRALYWCGLPRPGERVEGGNIQWQVLTLEHTVVDMAFALYEHDLMAIVTTDLTHPTYQVELLLFSLSTGLPHPHARRHRIPILNSPHERPAVGMEIVGRHLVLVLSWYANPSRPDNELYVLEWMQGDIKMHVSRPYGTYSSLVHLTEFIFVLPNARQFTLDFWSIPKNPEDPVPIKPDYILGLPRLNEAWAVGSISCRGEPNPIGEECTSENQNDSKDAGSPTTGTFYYCKRPFLPDPLESLIIFNIRVQPLLPPFFNVGLAGTTFTFFVHRRALLDLYKRRQGIRKDERPSSNEQPEEEDAANEGSVDTPPLTPESGTNTAENVHPSTSASPEPVSFEDWAPPITRWLNSDVLPTRWITTTCGQRCVLIANQAIAQAGTRGFPLVVLDFNPSRIRRQLKKGRGQQEEDGEERWSDRRGSRTWVVSQAEEIDSEGAFMPLSYSPDHEEAGVRTALPYIATTSYESFSFEGVLMDEERILGINTDMLDRIQSVRVHYFG